MLATNKILYDAETKCRSQHGWYFLWFVSVLLIFQLVTACSTSSSTAPPVNACDTQATVRNLTGLDGCGYVLELENGEKLEPVLDSAQASATIKGTVLRDGMQVKISYRLLKDRVSICMAGDIVEITCISEVKQADKN